MIIEVFEDADYLNRRKQFNKIQPEKEIWLSRVQVKEIDREKQIDEILAV